MCVGCYGHGVVCIADMCGHITSLISTLVRLLCPLCVLSQVPGLWNFLLKGLNVRSVVDVGCGRGISTRWFMDHGADV